MRSLLTISAFVGLALADCAANNCIRAVRGTRIPSRPNEGTTDCQSFLLATVTPATTYAPSHLVS